MERILLTLITALLLAPLAAMLAANNAKTKVFVPDQVGNIVSA